MGQRAALLLSELLLLLLTASRSLLAVSFPEDVAPLDVVDAHFSRRYPVFRGRPSANESQHRLDFQLMTKIQDTLFIKLTWRSGQDDRDMCAVKGKHRDECHNFIKVLVPRNDDLVFICGTNGFNPMCRYYRLDNLEFDGEEINGLARCPFDSKQTNVALFAGTGLTHTHTYTHAHLPSYAEIPFSSVPLSPSEPHFLHAAEYGNYVYFFYREIAVEHSNLGKVVYSRVARICKNDVGGSQRVLEKHWTSFVKARFNCSVPGESFFYFDVLQSITDIININGVPSVVGVFTTQMNSIPGSAVCAFSMADIEKVFWGRFKEQKTPDSVWTPFPEEKLPKPRPGSCAGHGPAASFKSSIEFPDETLQFIKSHPLMDTAVPSTGDEPWFTKTRVRYRLTALAVDNEAGPHKNYTVVFIGAESGVILKVLAKTSPMLLNDSLLLEEIDVFNKAKCLSNHDDDKRVLSLHVDKDAHSLYVAFSSCVIRIPLSRCERHSSCHKSCIASRDPYCGWRSHGACERIQPGVLTGYEQDVELGNTAHLGDCHGVVNNQLGDTNQMVHMNILITCVFAAFLMGALLAGLIVFCYRDSFLRKPRRVHKDAESDAPSCSDSAGSFVKLNGLFDSPVKEYQTNMDSPKLYTNLLSNGKDLNTSNGDTKTMILRDGCQPPELAALPTPESTPVLQQKGLQPIKNQWERAHGKVTGSHKESNSSAKSPQFLLSSPAPANPHHSHLGLGHSHIPSAVVLPNATHEHQTTDNEDEPLPHSSEKKLKNIDAKGGRRDQKRSVDARNTLNDLLKHLNDSVANPKAIFQEGSGPHQRPQLTLEPMEELTEMPPKVPSREASLYSPSSSLPRHSPTKRVDVPMPTTPTTPTGSLSMGGTLERQRGGYQLHRSASHRQSLSTSPNVTMGVSVSRQQSMNRGGYMPPTPPSRLDSHGALVASGMHTPNPSSLSRQSSYSGHGSLPRTGVKRTPSIKPDVPPKPNGFSPQTPQMRVVNKYSY
uniref:Sema domain, transmembrane domain (TM), and cytoplasmic domain, (semaphorin) 6D, like n=1 Tax=Oryzias latipes TaxID=8090 RepID=A0A3P9LI17_ORYLA